MPNSQFWSFFGHFDSYQNCIKYWTTIYFRSCIKFEFYFFLRVSSISVYYLSQLLKVWAWQPYKNALWNILLSLELHFTFKNVLIYSSLERYYPIRRTVAQISFFFIIISSQHGFSVKNSSIIILNFINQGKTQKRK